MMMMMNVQISNQTRRYKRNRQMSYGPNKLYQLRQTLKLLSYEYFTCLLFLLIHFPGEGRGAHCARGAPRHVHSVPNVKSGTCVLLYLW
jgi:hypothetical protein